MREREEEATPHPSYKYKKREVSTNNAVCPSGINESLYAFNYVSSTRLAKASEDNDLLENLGTYNQGFSQVSMKTISTFPNGVERGTS